MTEANIIYTLHDDEWFRILSLHLNKDIKMIYHVLCGMIVNNNYVVGIPPIYPRHRSVVNGVLLEVFNILTPEQWQVCLI